MHKHTKTNVPKWINIPCPDCGGKKKVINGLWLREIREKAGMDQRMFGREVNASGPYISDIERNRRDVSNDILEEYLRIK